jgi:hypothetical protein
LVLLTGPAEAAIATQNVSGNCEQQLDHGHVGADGNDFWMRRVWLVHLCERVFATKRAGMMYVSAMGCAVYTTAKQDNALPLSCNCIRRCLVTGVNNGTIRLRPGLGPDSAKGAAL